MTPTYSATGRHRQLFVPAPAESIPRRRAQDPPIYRALLRIWADRGRTLPGRHDPEWVRLAAPPAVLGRLGTGAPFSGTRDPRGDGR
ncbi:hypothetical protein ACFS5L_15655 [Streptomyces phyllanthi]|uniref:Uncharacterized protein n=1 Tax=Streptomyces phyllanthi TaxID=1803180 RepID=A0A5N8WDU5_9ACTN|nr:hypothetical protein [Streptomyces phyllanthi]